MDDQQPAQQNASPIIESSRLPYDAELFRHAEQFCKNALQDIPELAALAIVPVWITPPEKMPPALLRFRNPMEPPMAGILQLVENMLKFSQNLHRELVGQYQMFAQHAKELDDKIKEYNEQLNAKEPT